MIAVSSEMRNWYFRPLEQWEVGRKLITKFSIDCIFEYRVISMVKRHTI